MPLKKSSRVPDFDGDFPSSPLYPILDASFSIAWPCGSAVAALARAGCRLIQLRAKELASGAFHDWALEGVLEARRLGVHVLINDRVDIALITGAAGVHLGQEDLSPHSARRIMGPRAIIGFSTHSVDQAVEAGRFPLDYIAIGPVYATPTKKSELTPLGPEGVARVRKVVHKPLVAIGGITMDNGGAVLEAGADKLAVISALSGGDDLETTARKLLDNWFPISQR